MDKQQLIDKLLEKRLFYSNKLGRLINSTTGIEDSKRISITNKINEVDKCLYWASNKRSIQLKTV